MPRPYRVTFQEFDTTSEIGGVDGSTYVLFVVTFVLDDGEGVVLRRTASVGVIGELGRRRYEPADDTWAGEPALQAAIVEYVKEAERFSRAPVTTRNHHRLERQLTLELNGLPR